MLRRLLKQTEGDEGQEMLQDRQTSIHSTLPVIQTVGAAVVILDLKGRITFFNHAAEVCSGYLAQEVMGKRIWDFLISPEDAATVGQAFEDLKDLGLQTQMETSWITRDKKKRIVEWSNAPALDEGGKLKWIVDTYVDMTDQRETERQLEKAKKALEQAVRTRDDFISIASHELRTPLTSLRLQIQMLKRLPEVGSVSPLASRLLEGADQQLSRMSGLILDMLDTVNISLGRLKLKIEDADLVFIVKNVISQLNGLSSETQVQVELLAPEPVRGQWDRSRIEQVILNLMTNAIKYSMGRPIRVRVKKVGDRGLVEIEDQGQGIAQEEQGRVFERFARGRDGRQSGLGLGLYISRKIADAHRGELRLKSEPGRGSTFILELPLESDTRSDRTISFAA